MTADNQGDLDLALLRHLGGGVPVTDDTAKARARRRLERLITDGADAGALGSRWTSRKLIALVAACLSLIFLSQVFLPLGRGGPTRAEAALRELATTASAGLSLELGQNDTTYERILTTARMKAFGVDGGELWSVDIRSLRERWIASDGSGRILSTFLGSDWPSEGDTTAWEAAGSPRFAPRPEEDDRFSPGELTLVQGDSVSSDVEALGGAIEARSILPGPDGDLASFDIVGDLLRPRYLAPEQRAALFQVAAAIPGIVHDGTVTDGAGREGIGISITEGSTRLQLIFDPASSEVLGERTFEIQPDGEQVLMQEYAYLEAGIVASIDDRP